ncbi:MAG: nucleoside 2-deoxyribosyltransferase [Candidatus Nezhaarchaeota archaeon]|nr:nucleoside 2-deoxyribosyltransferase [Candidatus Nezhaarchaeota archaeon]
MVKVFISGPIQGMENKQEYRKEIRRIVETRGCEVIDPWEREKVIYRATEGEWWRNVPPKDFIERDLKDVERCDVLVAYLPRLSAGACMELFYAKLKGKKVISIIEFDNPSPWITLHSDVVLKSLKEFENYVKKGGLEELLGKSVKEM